MLSGGCVGCRWCVAAGVGPAVPASPSRASAARRAGGSGGAPYGATRHGPEEHHRRGVQRRTHGRYGRTARPLPRLEPGWRGSRAAKRRSRTHWHHDPAQHGHGMVAPLGGHEREPAHAIPRAKKAAAFLRISTSSSSRLFSRLSRCSSACSALRAASASAEPAARCSARHALSCPGLSPSSVATSLSPLPPSSSRLTAAALNSAVNRRRVPPRPYCPPRVFRVR